MPVISAALKDEAGGSFESSNFRPVWAIAKPGSRQNKN
jgi:hypothetical protein